MRCQWENILEEGLSISERSNCNLLVIDNPLNSKEYKKQMAKSTL